MAVFLVLSFEVSIFFSYVSSDWNFTALEILNSPCHISDDIGSVIPHEGIFESQF